MTGRLREDHRCTCGHYDDIHLRRIGRCTGTDSYGFACECVGFEHCDSCMDFDNDVEEDAEEDERQKPHPYPDRHYRHLLDDNSTIDRREPE